jgi:ABC-2 type transport system permease protein
MVAGVVALVPAGQLSAAADEERSGRLTHLVTRSTPRSSWLLGRLCLCGAALTTAGVLAGLGVWVGARSQGLPLAVGDLVTAGLDTVPTAVLVLGVGAVVLAVAPRAAGTVVYVVVLWSLFVDLVSPLVGPAAWLDRASVFRLITPSPGQQSQVAASVLTTLAGVALCAVSTVLAGRRDVG